VVKVISPGVGSNPVRVAVPLPATVRVLLPALKLKTFDVSDSVETTAPSVAVYSKPVCPVIRVGVNVTHPVQGASAVKLPLEAPMLLPGGVPVKLICVDVKVSVP
jgi:hypothetical protein